MKILFLRHFKPNIEQEKPVSEWGLSNAGIEEMNKLIHSKKIDNISEIISSPENKALVTAKKISETQDIEFYQEPLVAEVDRSKAGYIEGDYKEIVKKYLSGDLDFEYAWEPLESVKSRCKDLICNLEEKRNILIISHGMFLSILLSEYFNKDIVEFWQELRFGELLEVDSEKLKQIWNGPARIHQ